MVEEPGPCRPGSPNPINVVAAAATRPTRQYEHMVDDARKERRYGKRAARTVLKLNCAKHHRKGR
jgi:hypothetical protein